jgi:predicted ribosome quality control (RQC) complex YloA/Tae2 family protein
MRLKLFYLKSVHENAAYYYQLAKESREKMAGVEKAIEGTKKEMEDARKEAGKQKPGVRVKRQKEWYEKFHSAFTSSGKLLIGGRSAQQNDQLVSKHMEDNDLFFHADIQGGAVFILKDGANATEEDLMEAAQMAASFSNAWKNANAGVDVYCVKRSQLTKNVSGGFVPSGAFAILGERRWFKGMPLVLRIGVSEKGIGLVPDRSRTHLKDELLLVPALSGKDKGTLAKSLSKRFGVHPDELLELLPNGKSKTIEK